MYLGSEALAINEMRSPSITSAKREGPPTVKQVRPPPRGGKARLILRSDLPGAGMNEPTTASEALYALAVMSGVLRYCPRHGTYYRGEGVAEDAMQHYDRHIAEARKFFASPVAFYTAMKTVRSKHRHIYCPECTNAVGFN